MTAASSPGVARCLILSGSHSVSLNVEIIAATARARSAAMVLGSRKTSSSLFLAGSGCTGHTSALWDGNAIHHGTA